MAAAAGHETLRETAAGWHDRIHRDNVSEETRAEWAAWLAESPEHRAAYQQIDRAWAELESAAHDPRILALRHETALRLTRRTSRSTRVLTWSAAAVILVVIGASLATLSTDSMRGRSSISSLVDAVRSHADGRYATATGERLSVTLSDGSQLTLNTQTELSVHFTGTERTVHLARGQAFFEVAKDAARPFVVEAHRSRFVAVGTAFDVRLDGERINVTMIEGAVRVERTTSGAAANVSSAATRAPPAPSGSTRPEPDEDAGPVTTLIAGEQLIVDRQSDSVRNANVARVTSWRQGQVIFEDTRLADAISEINRYSERKIELADPVLADLRLSGGFATGRPTVFVEAVTAYFPVQVLRADHGVVVLGPRQ